MIWYHEKRTGPPPTPMPDFPPSLQELHDTCDWPESIDWLKPENINLMPQSDKPHCRSCVEWLRHWYGIGSTEKHIAEMVLRYVLGYNPFQEFYKGWGLTHWWDTCGGDSQEEKARALNEMNYRLGYTEFFWVPIDKEWTGVPF